jgi:putative transcriptional regulator
MEAITESANDLLRLGLIDEAKHRKITLRDLPPGAGKVLPISGEEIRSLRETAEISQATLARYLNVSTGYVAQLERGAKIPSGPALVLLDLVRKNGIGILRD